jgi:hypothetical protein
VVDAGLILAALVAWNPPQGGRSTTPDVVLDEWAGAIASACDLNEDGRTLSTRECLTLAAIASEETHFAPYVLDGSCQRVQWRREHPKLFYACDAGRAFGVFQVWPAVWASVAPAGGEDPSNRDPFVNALIARRLLLKNPRGWMTYEAARAKADKWVAAHPQ